MTATDDQGRDGPAGSAGPDLQALLDALSSVASRDADLAARLTRMFTAIAAEAGRGPRFANALTKALQLEVGSVTNPDRAKRQAHRRNAGPFDPFQIYKARGEAALRDELEGLPLDQLRDIVAEHAMDNDRLAMKWKDPARVVGRIVERVIDRSAKGSAFRDS